MALVLLPGNVMSDLRHSPALEVFDDHGDKDYPQDGKTMKPPFPEELEALADEALRQK